jgi:hypothetical protein
MIRFALTFLTFLTFLSPATAIVTPRRERLSGPEKGYLLIEKQLQDLSSESTYLITEKTEVLLDGRKCPYEKVPNSAKIILMEIDSEANKVILRIHFQSQK